MKEFLKKNLTLLHIMGLLCGFLFAIIYWWKVGQFSEMMIKNNAFIISLMGAAIGYITFDFINEARKKNNGE